jgi:hypothetical protein
LHETRSIAEFEQPDDPVVPIRADAPSRRPKGMDLKLLEINAAGPDPEQGVIEKAEHGHPNVAIRERSELSRA